MSEVDASLDAHMARFAPRRTVGGAAPAAPIKPLVPPTNPSEDRAPAAAAAAPQAPAETPAVAATKVADSDLALDPDSVQADDANIVALLPREALGKRVMNAIHREVDKWEPPAVLSKQEVKQFRSMAATARVLNAIDTIGKYNLGKFFLLAKERFKHGEFMRYLEACDVANRTATRYMAVAAAFPEPALVRMLSFTFCYDVANMNLDSQVLARIHAAESREEAEGILANWEELQTINAAWLGIHETPVQAYGHTLALALSKPPFVREFRAMLPPVPRDHVDRVIDRYKSLLIQFDDGAAVVRYMQGQPLIEAPAESAEEPQLTGVFRLRNFHTRLDALAASEGLPLDGAAEALAKEIEAKLVDLTRLLQAKAAQ